MAQIKLLKIAADGVPLEHSAAADELTMLSFAITSGGPALSGSGLDMNGQDVSDLSDLVFTDPSVGTINQTAGALIADNIMAKERSNTLTTAADILFPVIADSAGQVDAFRLPALAGVPSAAPTAAGEGFMVYDSTNNDLYIWDGAAWDNQNTVNSAKNIDDAYVADGAIAARDVVYISAADKAKKAKANAAASSQAVGFASASAADTDPVNIRKFGRLAGFSSLTPGARQFLDDAVAGAIVEAPPSASGASVIQVGYAKNATTVDIAIQSLGRRA